jgi:hypothetical protein
MDALRYSVRKGKGFSSVLKAGHRLNHSVLKEGNRV